MTGEGYHALDSAPIYLALDSIEHNLTALYAVMTNDRRTTDYFSKEMHRSRVKGIGVSAWIQGSLGSQGADAELGSKSGNIWPKTRMRRLV